MTSAPRRPIALLAVLGTVLVLGAGCVSADIDVQQAAPPSTTEAGSGSGPGATSPAPDPLGDQQLSEWTDCDDGLQCATLPVPLDWKKPKGKTIDLAVIRKPAAGPGERIGSVLFNPGGPGEGGTEFLRQFLAADRIPKGLDQRLDLVSWDPRGTGGSVGVRCLTDEQLAAPDPDPTIDSPADVQAIDQRADETLAGCQKDVAAGVLTRVGTKNTVRDLDALRAALGDEKLTYVGYSYGTTIGIEYASMFPTHIRAMVLDGVAPPGRDPVAATHDQGLSFEHNLDAFLDDCAARASCLFGNGNPRKAFTDLVAKLETGIRLPGDYTLPDAKGVDHRRRGTVGVGELYSATLAALYSRESWPALETGLAGAEIGNGQTLLLLRDTFAGRQDDGTWNHIGEANQAINCADQKARATDADGDDALRPAWSAEMPLLGSVFAVGTPGCYGAAPALEPLTTPAAASFEGIPPVVVVGSTEDPATPYQDSVEAQRTLPGSVLATWESADHTGYGRGSDCLDTPLTAYLTDLKVPAKGLRCKP